MMPLPQPLSVKEMMAESDRWSLAEVRCQLCCRGTSAESFGAFAPLRNKPVSRAKNQNNSSTRSAIQNGARTPAKPQSQPLPSSTAQLLVYYILCKQLQYEFHRQPVLMSSIKRITHVILARVAFLHTRHWYLCLGCGF